MSRVFVTGDTHRVFESIERFCVENNTTQNDYLIILGYAGINYTGDINDIYLKRYISGLPISLFCVHGNHEMRPEHVPTYQFGYMLGACLCNAFYIEPEYPNIMFGIDGGIYGFCGKTCIVIGGAYSVDKYYRLMSGRRWFADEQPSDEIKRRVERVLDANNHKIDVVLSHTCPAKYIPTEMFLPGVDQSTVDTSTEEWLDDIEDKLTYQKWLCGHYHTDKKIDRMRFMFNDIVLLSDLLEGS